MAWADRRKNQDESNSILSVAFCPINPSHTEPILSEPLVRFCLLTDSLVDETSIRVCATLWIKPCSAYDCWRRCRFSHHLGIAPVNEDCAAEAAAASYFRPLYLHLSLSLSGVLQGFLCYMLDTREGCKFVEVVRVPNHFYGQSTVISTSTTKGYTKSCRSTSSPLQRLFDLPCYISLLWTPI